MASHLVTAREKIELQTVAIHKKLLYLEPSNVPVSEFHKSCLSSSNHSPAFLPFATVSSRIIWSQSRGTDEIMRRLAWSPHLRAIIITIAIRDLPGNAVFLGSGMLSLIFLHQHHLDRIQCLVDRHKSASYSTSTLATLIPTSISVVTSIIHSPDSSVSQSCVGSS